MALRGSPMQGFKPPGRAVAPRAAAPAMPGGQVRMPNRTTGVRAPMRLTNR